MIGSLLGLLVGLPLWCLAGLAALAAFAVLYLNGVAPGRQTGRAAVPQAAIGGPALLVALLLALGLPRLLNPLFGPPTHSDPATLDEMFRAGRALGAHPLALLQAGSGLLAALLLLGAWNDARRGEGLFPWGGGKWSRPVFAFLALLPFLGLSAWIARLLVEGLLGGSMPHELVSGLHLLDGVDFWGSVLILVLLAPLVEELLFRGAVFAAAGSVARRAGRAPEATAVLFSTLAFTLLHPPAVWLPLAVLGLALGLIRLHSGGLRDCILIHQAYNLTVLLITFPTPES